MFDNIGGKIRKFAKIIFRIGILLGLVTVGIIIYFMGEISYLGGIIAAAVVVLPAYILSIFLYGFGELIEKTCSIERTLRGEDTETPKE